MSSLKSAMSIKSFSNTRSWINCRSFVSPRSIVVVAEVPSDVMDEMDECYLVKDERLSDTAAPTVASMDDDDDDDRDLECCRDDNDDIRSTSTEQLQRQQQQQQYTIPHSKSLIITERAELEADFDEMGIEVSLKSFRQRRKENVWKSNTYQPRQSRTPSLGRIGKSGIFRHTMSSLSRSSKGHCI
jgi:hypothetical protein